MISGIEDSAEITLCDIQEDYSFIPPFPNRCPPWTGFWDLRMNEPQGALRPAEKKNV